MNRFLLAAALLAGPAAATQVVLAPANVIGSSGYYTACCTFNPGGIFDQQTGEVTENFDVRYWLNADNGPAKAFITVDLGASAKLGSVALFNTHNSGYNDRGTGDFTITASNSVTDLGGGNFALTGATTIVSGTLAPETSSHVFQIAQSFAVSGRYRYLSFNPISVSVSGSACCGANVYGLDELRVFTVVPEPSSWALLVAGFGLIGVASRRRKAIAA